MNLGFIIKDKRAKKEDNDKEIEKLKMEIKRLKRENCDLAIHHNKFLTFLMALVEENDNALIIDLNRIKADPLKMLDWKKDATINAMILSVRKINMNYN